MSLRVIQLSEIALFLLQKGSSFEKASPTKTEDFQISPLDLKQTWQTKS